MKVETRNRIVEHMDAISRSLSNGRAFHEVAAGLCRGLRALLAKIETMDSEAKIIAALDEMAEPSEELLKTIDTVAPMIPAVVGGLMRSQAKSALKALPTSKRGPKRISLAEREAICDCISALERSGCNYEAARTRAGLRFGRSYKSVVHIWEERSKDLPSYSEDELGVLLGEFLKTGETPNTPPHNE